MQIEFTGKFAPASGGDLHFEAIVDGVRVICIATCEALQDVEPSNIGAPAVDQFLANQDLFQHLAQNKIRALAPRPVRVTSADVLG